MTSQPSTFTFQVDEAQAKTLQRLLEERGLEFREMPYTQFSAQGKKLSVSCYTSGKLVVQGKEAKEFIEFTLEPEVLGTAKLGYEEVHHPERFEPHIGIDESGKGDFFGPLVIAGAYVNREIVLELMKRGVRDSKLIKSDKKALDLAEEIKKVPGIGWNVIAIGPEKYNELYGKFKNLNRLLAWGHVTVLENLLEKHPTCPRALSDKFADDQVILRQLKERGKKIIMEQRTKAESDWAVAAASILARAAFLEGLERLGKTVELTLPKGASSQVLACGREIGSKFGEEKLRTVAKAHFKTFEESMGRTPPERPEFKFRRD